MPEVTGFGFRLNDDEGLPPVPEENWGQRFVSHRVWQLKRETPSEDLDLFSDAMKVLGHVGGGTMQALVEDEEESYRTVVEAVTILRSPDEFVATDLRPDALTLCLETLFDAVRAYRLVDQARISELTYERIHAAVPYRWRRLDPPEFFGPTFVMMLSHANVTTPVPGILDQEKIEQHRQRLERLTLGDPFTLYSERRLEARISQSRDGQYAESAIQSAIAAEVLLDGVLGMLLWEESLPSEGTDDASEVLSSDLARRIRTQFHPRLGGTWSLKSDGHIRQWYEKTAGLRNRVVHRGYRPHSEESEESLQTVYALERFICDLLAEKSNRYPRTALAILGAEGLRRRGKWNDIRFGSEAIGPNMENLRRHATWRDRVDDARRVRRTA